MYEFLGGVCVYDIAYGGAGVGEVRQRGCLRGLVTFGSGGLVGIVANVHHYNGSAVVRVCHS